MKVTGKTLLEIASHEACVRQAYKDSVGVWTWGFGITSKSGHSVERYKDNPQTTERCLDVFAWALEKYAKDVRSAFAPIELSENQFAAALSFHYNTGGIKTASWVKEFKAGNTAKAKSSFMNWSKPKEIIPRRQKERDLFFDGKWGYSDGFTEYERVSASYSPVWSSAKKVFMTVEEANKIVGGGGPVTTKPAAPTSVDGLLSTLWNLIKKALGVSR